MLTLSNCCLNDRSAIDTRVARIRASDWHLARSRICGGCSQAWLGISHIPGLLLCTQIIDCNAYHFLAWVASLDLQMRTAFDFFQWNSDDIGAWRELRLAILLSLGLSWILWLLLFPTNLVQELNVQTLLWHLQIKARAHIGRRSFASLLLLAPLCDRRHVSICSGHRFAPNIWIGALLLRSALRVNLDLHHELGCNRSYFGVRGLDRLVLSDLLLHEAGLTYYSSR